MNKKGSGVSCFPIHFEYKDIVFKRILKMFAPFFVFLLFGKVLLVLWSGFIFLNC